MDTLLQFIHDDAVDKVAEKGEKRRYSSASDHLIQESSTYGTSFSVNGDHGETGVTSDMLPAYQSRAGKRTKSEGSGLIRGKKVYVSYDRPTSRLNEYNRFEVGRILASENDASRRRIIMRSMITDGTVPVTNERQLARIHKQYMQDGNKLDPSWGTKGRPRFAAPSAVIEHFNTYDQVIEKSDVAGYLEASKAVARAEEGMTGLGGGTSLTPSKSTVWRTMKLIENEPGFHKARAVQRKDHKRADAEASLLNLVNYIVVCGAIFFKRIPKPLSTKVPNAELPVITTQSNSDTRGRGTPLNYDGNGVAIVPTLREMVENAFPEALVDPLPLALMFNVDDSTFLSKPMSEEPGSPVSWRIATARSVQDSDKRALHYLPRQDAEDTFHGQFIRGTFAINGAG